MANRRFEMHQYRHVLVRMRLGQSDRAIARASLIGRKKASALRSIAHRQGWLELCNPLPDESILAEVLDRDSFRPQPDSLVAPYEDDFGLKPLAPPHEEDFHDLVAERYERAATIGTSNLDFSEWGDAFSNRLLGAATLDRLRHGAYRIILDGQSYRSPRPLPEAPEKALAKEVKKTLNTDRVRDPKIALPGWLH